MRQEDINWNDWFYYDETSPSYLRWKVDRFNGRYRNVKTVSAHDVAGCLNARGYYVAKLSGKQYLAHRVIYELMKGPLGALHIDHVNGNPSDNRISNLRAVSHKENHRNQKMYNRNASGVSGVGVYSKESGRQYWRSHWCDLTGKKRSKYFSIDMFGYDEAFRLACEHRTKMIEELNAAGAGYSDRHGT